MRSSEDGFRLLNKWKTNGAEIRLSFSGIDNKWSISGAGIIVGVDTETMRFTGAGFELFLDLRDADFENVGTEEVFRRLGLDPEEYTESAEIWLGSGDKAIFFGRPGRGELRAN